MTLVRVHEVVRVGKGYIQTQSEREYIRMCVCVRIHSFIQQLDSFDKGAADVRAASSSFVYVCVHLLF